MGSKVNEITSKYDERIGGMSSDLSDIKELLRLGFRLPEDHLHFSDKDKGADKSGAQIASSFVAKAKAVQNQTTDVFNSDKK